MARPKSIPVEVKEPTPDARNLKKCPRCGDAPTGPVQDVNGNWRCSCSHPKCNFWESVVSYTAADAIKKWQEAGGPSPID